MELALAPEGCSKCDELRHKLDVARRRARVAEARVRRLTMQVDDLQRRVRELSGEAKATSNNSSLPPSMNPPGVKHARSAAEDKPKRKIGGQPGHKGKGRKLLPSERVDQVVRHGPGACSCGSTLLLEEKVLARHQVMELADQPVEVTEHQAIGCRCGKCGKELRGEIPGAVKASVCGERLTGLIGLLSARMHVSREKVEEFLEVALGAKLGVGTVMAREKELAEALAGPYGQLKQTVADAAVKHVDETGWKGKANWLWVAAAADAVVFGCSHARTWSALAEMLGEKITGVICTDRYGVYDRHPKGRRGICWAHLKRDFQRCVDRGGESRGIGEAGLEVVRGVFQWWRFYKRGKITRKTLGRKLRPLRRRLKAALREGARLKIPKTSGLCRRLLRLWGPMWRFVEVEALEPTNNLAERMLRNAVVWRKMSLGSQSRAGLRFVERMLSVAMTMQARGRGGELLGYLAAAIGAHRNGLPPPVVPG